MTSRKLIRLGIILAVVVGPLAALSIGKRVADEETLARAEAGARNYEAPDRFPDASYGLPELEGAAAETTVRDITDGAALFDRYNSAVKQAGFADVLEGPGPLTVFAPTDHVFAQLSESEREGLFADSGKLVQMLSNHVARGRLSATDLLQRDHVDTVGGQRVTLGNDGQATTFGDADIVRTDLVAGNGVVHIVDGVNL